MSNLIKRERLFPAWADDWFNNFNVFSPPVWGINGDDMKIAKTIPSVNVTENEKDYKIEMAAPGLEKKDFKVEVDNGFLTISSEKKEESKEEKKNYTRQEYAYSSFSRSFSLPENSDPDKLDAKYDNGVLILSLPKKEVAVKKTKEVKVS